jgi:uncharacterized coiled-coil protein SlyX
MTDNERVETLEIKIAHLERGLQELSDVVVRQQRELDQLLQRNRWLQEQLESLRQGTDDRGQPPEIPPHY